MSIMCQRAERAVCKALVQEGSSALNGVNVFDAFEGVASATVTNVYEQAVDGELSYTLSFYTGETQETVNTPAVVVHSTNSSPDDDAVGNELVDVNVDVILPAESGPSENVIQSMEAISVWVNQVLHRSDLAELVTNQHDGLTVCGVDPSGYSGARLADGRQRMHRYTVRLYCAGKMMAAN